MHLPTIGVVRGGVSDEYDVSLQTGGAVLSSLARQGYPLRDILITKDGTWHLDGAPTTPARVARSVNLVWNGLHGHYGEDGKIQQVFETHRIPYTGSSPLASALGLHKGHTRVLMNEAGLRVSHGTIAYRDEHPREAAHRVFTQFGPPYIIKPIASGSSIGVVVAQTLSELAEAIGETHREHEAVIVEEKLLGREIVTGAVASRDGAWNVLWPLEVSVPERVGFLTYQQKTHSSSPHAPLASAAESEDIAHLVRRAARALGARHYITADFIQTPRGAYLLELNTQPGLAPHAAFPRMLAASDVSFDEFVAHTITLALQGK